MPIEPEAFAAHMTKHGPYFFHVTSAEYLDSIMRDGLRPSSELRRTARDGFFRPRKGRVYICGRDCTKEVPAKGSRTILQVDLRKLDPTYFDTDEDVPRDEELQEVQGWFAVKSPCRKLLADSSEAPGQAGRLAKWAESIPEFDAPEFAERSLAAGKVAYRGMISPEALKAVKLPSMVVEAFKTGAEQNLGLRDLGRAPTEELNTVESERAFVIAEAVLKDGFAILDHPPLTTDRDLSELDTYWRLKDDIRRFAYQEHRRGHPDRGDLGFALADLAQAIFRHRRPWDASPRVSESAATCLSHIAKVASERRARDLSYTTLQKAALVQSGLPG